jgi:hypothetical protein
MPAGAKKPIYAPYVEHVPPDTTAAIFWLKLSARRTMSSGSTNSAKSGRVLEQLLDPRLELHLSNHRP